MTQFTYTDMRHLAALHEWSWGWYKYKLLDDDAVLAGN